MSRRRLCLSLLVLGRVTEVGNNGPEDLSLSIYTPSSTRQSFGLVPVSLVSDEGICTPLVTLERTHFVRYQKFRGNENTSINKKRY